MPVITLICLHEDPCIISSEMNKNKSVHLSRLAANINGIYSGRRAILNPNFIEIRLVDFGGFNKWNKNTSRFGLTVAVALRGGWSFDHFIENKEAPERQQNDCQPREVAARWLSLQWRVRWDDAEQFTHRTFTYRTTQMYWRPWIERKGSSPECEQVRLA